MQLKQKNMFEIVKFIHVIFIFLSIFLVSTNVNAGYRCNSHAACVDKHCYEPKVPRCIKTRCNCVDLRYWQDVDGAHYDVLGHVPK
ncbi:unnamed protein product [Trifolium pratense]|uniref:Uncharacterized protein n=1 Tax=Trifolium pratense TaxID=57577 RepID=A0ACB0J5Q4_TRIPR|nr:unnamed protein product [Trifolium pratense]